ncbi:MAG: TIGR01212 family radical SAM protein [Bdellovibrionales bacterium CG10_big_fil_rev_8_21_14_0_10_45_34]|nr:MAG: TIGR01212 family radical SAM protein [Bdellovibrionales bacterium CG10_big_fil_rev_8_21_14_0_10_45_34]
MELELDSQPRDLDRQSPPRRWGVNLPYNPISEHYKNLFGEKVYKIPISIAEDCPNRQGLKGMETCIFCDEWGSAAYPEERAKTVAEQIEVIKPILSKKYKAKKFLVYFQAYTNTFVRLEQLKQNIESALKCKDVVGIVLGTRPDCLSAGLLKYWGELSQTTYLSVELGVQSFFEEQVAFLKRGHTAAQSIRAIYKIHEFAPHVDLGVHFIFGIPGETRQDIIESAKICSQMPIGQVKLHNLHVLINTPLAEMYNQGLFEPISLDAYSGLAIDFLEHLSPSIAVHRLGALAKRWDELVAPDWNKHKMMVAQHIIAKMRTAGSYQGRLFCGNPSTQLQ